MPRPHPPRRPSAIRHHRIQGAWSPHQVVRLAQLTAEVLAGERAPVQVEPLLEPRPFSMLCRRAGAFRERTRPRVLRTWVRPQGPSVAEAAALIGCGRRRRVLAFRVARKEGMWVCTDLETDVGKS
ncbi:Rv3235 family protein [Nocardiopsis suaedae]|uniref:Rv3235 family protein n=1 Tax=Nocardiopsis suaedae TaxID=3018444 RepID=A0ABT4TTD5_9ACTN|nr:Rv3235 family protein [Nocardiopsis suaedae]MDA2807953.1 Rv3235 family protein [Nocardiopsis suaedae]